jgi:sensor histidine kinase YesM
VTDGLKLRVAACGVGGALLALPLHVWMHKAVPGLATAAWGGIGAVVPPLLLAPAWRDLPAFLRRPLDAAVAGIGVLLVAVSTVAARGALYSLLRRDEFIAAMLAVTLVSVAVAALVETHSRLAAVIATREQELAAERRSAIEARLRALQAQIRPHFLFNTFNALSELIHEDPHAAEDLVTDLAHLLRYSLRSSTDGQVPLSDELDAIRRYLRIEKARLGDRLIVVIEIDEDVADASVPGLILQPLVENAVQHAVAPRLEGGRIVIRGRRTETKLVLEVEDDGPGLPPAVRDGTATGLGAGGHGGGFANVRRRLGLRFGEEADLRVLEAPGGGTRIELRLPLRPSTSSGAA